MSNRCCTVAAARRGRSDHRLVFLPLDNAGGPVWSDLGIYVRAERNLPAYTESFLQELVRELGERERQENAAYPQNA